MKIKTDSFYDKEKAIKNNVPAEQHNDDFYLKEKVNRNNTRPVGIIAIIVACSLALLGLFILMMVL